MEYDDETTRVLILGDSRTRDMCIKIRRNVELLGPNIPIYVEAVPHRELDKSNLLELIKKDYRPADGKYDFLYFFGGVNDLSEKHSSGKITAVYDNVGQLVSTMFV